MCLGADERRDWRAQPKFALALKARHTTACLLMTYRLLKNKETGFFLSQHHALADRGIWGGFPVASGRVAAM